MFILFLLFSFSSNEVMAKRFKKKNVKGTYSRIQKKIKRKKSKKILLSEAVRYTNNTRDFISESWLSLNYGMDSFFSDQNYKKSENKSRILAYYQIHKGEGKDLQTIFDIRIKVHLPKLSRKLSITIQKERDELLEARSNEATKTQATKESDYVASVNYIIKDSPYYKSELKTGIRFTLPLDPYVKLRFYKGINFSWINIQFEQKFIRYKQDDFHEYTQMNFSKRLNKDFVFSQGNTLSWSDSDDNLVLRNSLNLNQQLSSKSTLSYSLGANAAFSPTFLYNSYDASLGLRHLLHKNWILGYFSVGSDFQRSNNWEPSLFSVLRLEVLFQ